MSLNNHVRPKIDRDPDFDIGRLLAIYRSWTLFFGLCSQLRRAGLGACHAIATRRQVRRFSFAQPNNSFNVLSSSGGFVSERNF